MSLNILVDVIRFVVLWVIIKPIDLFLDFAQGYFSGSRGSKPNPYLLGNYAPVHRERTGGIKLAVTQGALPYDLAGEFVRNGPNPVKVPKNGYMWFDGDGMLHGVKITKEGTVSYINRQTNTWALSFERKFGMLVEVRIGEMYGVVGLLKILFHGLKRALNIVPFLGSSANTGLVFHNNKLQALVEDDIPYHIRVLNDGQFETAGRLEYAGKVKAMTAHPKVDPVTKELFFFSYSLDPPPYLTYSYADPAGNIMNTMAIDIPEPVMMHDFAITEHYALFFDLSLVFDKKRMFKGNMFLFDKSHKARVGIMDRYAENSDGILWFPVPPNIVFHTANAREEGDEVILCTGKVTGDFDFYTNITENSFGLAEWRFNMRTKEFKEHLFVSEVHIEFPQVHPALVGRKNKYVYAAVGPISSKGLGGQYTGLTKVDIETKQIVKTFTYGVKKYGGEGVFVPKAAAKHEDDGYLLTFVYDENTDKSSFWVIDTSTMHDIIAIVDLPQRVPYGFHGIFMSEADILSQK